MTLYQIGSDPEFEKCLPDTLAEEDPDPANLLDPKNYSNDVHDPGGMTMDGIIQREYDVFRKAQGLPTRWIKNITTDEVRTIYHESYWLPYCPGCPAGINLCLFDTNVNNGIHAGIVLLQRALAITDDGQWGPQTSAAVAGLTKDALPLAIRHFYQKRAAYYQSLANFRYFGKDWMRRDADIQKCALAMAAAT